KASAAAGASTGTSDKKKRAHVPDLSTDAAPKKAARKAKAKSKAKAKAQALQLDAETTQDLQGCIDFNVAEVGCSEQDQAQSAKGGAKETDAEGHGQGSRQRLWLDDLLSAVERCLTGPYALFKNSPATKTMRAVVLSLGLEFACSGTVVLRKKPLKVWSQVRPALQNMFVAALTESQQQQTLSSGLDMQQVLQKMMSEVSSGSAGRLTGAPSQVVQPDSVKQILHDKRSCQLCKDFLVTNSSPEVSKHPAFAACLSKVRAGFCTCPRTKDDWNPNLKCDFHDSLHTVQDMVWHFTKLMETEAVIDDSVPSLGAAAMVVASKLAQEEILAEIGKDASFLVSKKEASNHGEVVTLNDSIIATLITSRAKYMLTCMKVMMVIPDTRTDARDKGSGSKEPVLVEFEDLGPNSVRALYDIILHLCKDGQEYIMELETRFLMQNQNMDGVNTWAAMWIQVFERALTTRRKMLRTTEQKDRDNEKEGAPCPEHVLARKLLPPPSSVITKSFWKNAKSLLMEGGSVEAEIKEEVSAGSIPQGTHQAEAVDSSASATTIQPQLPFFQTIYTACSAADFGTKKTGDNGFHVLDVLAIQAQLQLHIISLAAYLVELSRFSCLRESTNSLQL
ncbi:unnamed protein product, partial [Symbiodinium necroappetens]